MKKQVSAILFAVMLTALAASACGNAKMDQAEQIAATDSASDDVLMNSGEMDRNQAMDSDAGAGLEDGASMKSEELVPEDGSIEASDAENASAAGTEKNQTQKLIFTYHYSVETKEFDDFYQKVNEKVTQLEGYMEHSETNGSAEDSISRHANLTLRIPADQMDQMLRDFAFRCEKE